MSQGTQPGAIALTAGRTGAGPRSARGNTGLTARVIPCLDVAGGRVVKGVKFQNLRDQGDPAACALRYAEDGADEIVFLDITAANERRSTNLEWVTRAAEQVFIPLTVGGGVRSVEDGRELLLAGADKVGVNTAAIADPALLTRLAERFGSQCVVLSVDARRWPPRNDGAGARWEVVTHGGRTATGKDALAWITEGIERGAGEILLTSIDADGTQAGYDLDLLAAVCARVTVPVVASGGAGSIDHLADALAAGASAVLAASIFHESTYTPDQVKRELASRGLPMRLAGR
jgi:cyclase